MNLSKHLILFCAFLMCLNPLRNAYSQTIIGGQIDNRAGIKGLTLNPANVINPRLKAEFNLITTSAYIGNDYIALSLKDLDKIVDFSSLQKNVGINPKPDNNFVGNLDILGPGFQINLDSRNSLAVTTRVRTFFNLNNIGGEFFQTIIGEEDTESYTLVMEDVSGVAQVWGELGLTYGRVLMEKNNLSLRSGVTLKYLAGAGGMVGSSDLLGGVYLETPNTLTTRGDLNFGYSSEFRSGGSAFEKIRPGFGMDLGLIFELQNQSKNEYTDGYKFKAGISVLDIGSIKYTDFENWNYDMDNSVDLDSVDPNNIGDFLEENYSGEKLDPNTTLAMPTSLQIFADYSISNRFYLSALGSFSLREMGKIPASQVINSIVITPRIETGWLSVYSPISYRQYEKSISWGVGLRIGPATIGSASILSSLLSKNSRSADAYFGIQIPIYHKGVKRNRVDSSQ
ncbi:hypothetical protein DFQ04_2305 [Algoriphagus boseongensis]|uniref:DUF5723 domain-containing protein n=1 Tax=Algoriphagus boseongensis TaxID=1442587 RepID=A0A4R6T6H9_9BACT|nr:DUF5723 family protein [Algoriphagus boseongensis]TDQ17649.1 hypothetical protein DFQ04_2305 [Algoriphagus boseongensis]